MAPVRALLRRLHRSFHHVHRGMTLLEIMIVLAILALVMGVLIGPSVIGHFRDAKKKIATMITKKYADEAYPAWAAAHPNKPCPDKLEDLDAFMNHQDTTDPWGHGYQMYCGSTLPPHASGLAVSSAGEDGKEGTADDIKSWD